MTRPRKNPAALEADALPLGQRGGNITIVMIMMIIMVALKDAIRDFSNLLTALRIVFNAYAQVARA